MNKWTAKIKDLKNQGQKIMLENNQVSFEELEGWENKYCDAVVRYSIAMDEIENKLR